VKEQISLTYGEDLHKKQIISAAKAMIRQSEVSLNLHNVYLGINKSVSTSDKLNYSKQKS